MAQLISFPVNCFRLFYVRGGGWGWHNPCHPFSHMPIMREGPGETPSASRFLSYLINSFLTDMKHPAKNYRGGEGRGTLSVPFWCLCQKLSMSLLYFNKTLLHKKLQVVKLHLWSQTEILSSGDHESWCNTWLAAATFQEEGRRDDVLVFLLLVGLHWWFRW